MKKLLLATIVLVMALLALTIVQAQEAIESPVYYIAADSNDVQQVYQHLLDGQSEPRVITYAETDVITFGAAHDGLGVAYISDGQLWLQPLHTEEPEALATVSASQVVGSPVFSQDGQYVAYADNGLWLVDLGTRETRQLLADVPLEESASNAGELRVFWPERFVLDEDGTASKLIVDVGVWEWRTSGVYDLASGEFQELEGQLHTSLLPLSDGRVLVYGNTGVGGEGSLHIADSLEDINTYSQVVLFSTLTEGTLFADQAVEIEPGIMRVFGPALTLTPAEVNALYFYFDFDLAAGTASEVNFVTLAENSESANTIAGKLSPDGRFIPVYLNALFTDFGSIYGAFKLVDVTTGETSAAEFPDMVGVFHWQGE
jgi:hypothetical protein